MTMSRRRGLASAHALGSSCRSASSRSCWPVCSYLVASWACHTACAAPRSGRFSAKLGGHCETTPLALKGGFFIVVAGFLMMAAGIGVMRRSNWARYLTLGVALCAPLAQVCIIILFAPGDLASGLFSVALTVGFAGFAGIVLLLPRYAAEFN